MFVRIELDIDSWSDLGFHLKKDKTINLRIGIPNIQTNSYRDAKKLFNEHGFLIIFLAGFTPLPYKAFTITAGYMSLALIPFMVASFFGRGLRFFIVAAIFYYFGIERANKIKKYFEYIGYIATILLIFIFYVKYFK